MTNTAIQAGGSLARRVATALTAIALAATSALAATPNNAAARKMFDEAYASVFGKNGSTMDYSVNIGGIYKVNGTVSMKGKRQRFRESRYSGWNDGRLYYKVDRKRKEIEVFQANSDKKDKYSDKFKFTPNNYTYSYTTTKTDYVITMTAKSGTRSNVRHAKIYLDRATRAPKTVKVKVLFFWATIKVANFKSGGINDEIFTFPAAQFRGYKLIDRRGDG